MTDLFAGLDFTLMKLEKETVERTKVVIEEVLEAFAQPQVAPESELEIELKKVQAIHSEMSMDYERIRAEAERQLLKLREDQAELYRRMKEIERLLLEEKLEAERRRKLEEELRQKQNAAENMAALEKKLMELCADFPAWDSAHEYQRDDILATIKAYEEDRNGMLNANDLGLGKTFESIVTLYILRKIFIEEYGRKPRILWLTKKSLVSSSPTEIKRWWPDCRVLTPKMLKANTVTERNYVVELYDLSADILLTNYEFVRTTPASTKDPWDLVVIDEVHKLKGGANQSGPTAIWVAIKDLCHKAKFILMLSGTPMVNRPEEMWSYLHIFNPERFDKLRTFERNFMTLKTFAGETKSVVDADKILRQALVGQMIRRNRSEVGLQLPELTEIQKMLTFNQDQGDVYDQMRMRFYVWLDEQQTQPLTATAIIAQLTRLRQINSWPAGIKITDPITNAEIKLNVEDSSKIDECMDIIESADDQVVVFCTFNEPMFEVQRRARKAGLSCEVIHGGTVEKMGEYEKDFQNGKLDVICINLAMAEGLNLQKDPTKWEGGSCVAVFLDKWWSPARNEQAVGRIHRQGQVMPCTVYYLENENSIDAFMNAKLDEKAAQFLSIMESNEIRPASDWRTYLEGMI